MTKTPTVLARHIEYVHAYFLNQRRINAMSTGFGVVVPEKCNLGAIPLTTTHGTLLQLVPEE